MKLKKVLSVVTVSALALALVACGKKTETEVQSEVVNAASEIVAELDVTSEIVSETEEEVGPINIDEIEGKEFFGTWQNDRCLIMIDPDSNGFKIHIHWASSYEEAADWTYFCLYNGSELVNHGDGFKKIIKYDEDGGVISETEEYNDAGVTFKLTADGKLTWSDDKETADDGLVFEKSNEED